jgi:hypothetical protein
MERVVIQTITRIEKVEMEALVEEDEDVAASLVVRMGTCRENAQTKIKVDHLEEEEVVVVMMEEEAPIGKMISMNL